MNKVIISGNICRDIEVMQTKTGRKVISNCVGVRRDRKDADGNYSTDFINIVVWNDQQVDYLERYANKGDRVEVVGRWTNRKYEDRNGSTVTVSECIVESINVFSSKPKEETKEPEIDPDDLPF